MEIKAINLIAKPHIPILGFPNGLGLLNKLK